MVKFKRIRTAVAARLEVFAVWLRGPQPPPPLAIRVKDNGFMADVLSHTYEIDRCDWTLGHRDKICTDGRGKYIPAWDEIRLTLTARIEKPWYQQCNAAEGRESA